MGQQTSKLTQNNVSAAVLKHLFPGFRVPILKLGPVLTEKKPGDLFLAMKGLCIRIGGEPTRMPSLKNDKRRSGFRSCMAVAVMMGPSLAYGSPACMTQSEARAKFPKAHLYWHGREQCWNDKAAFSSRALAAVPAASRPIEASVPVLAPEFGGPLETIRRALLGDTTQAGVPAASPRPTPTPVPAASSRPTQAAVPVASPRPVPAAVPAPSSRPVSTTDGSGSQCQLPPCE